ncbi:hypothetical protein HOC76_03800 [bacterium]|nr:hypothetical protein [bacterium]
MDDIQHQQMGYDRAATMFAPDGHILQVEYAEKTIRLGSASIGVVCKDAVVIVSDRRKKDILVVEESANKINEVDEHIICVSAGISSDARVLIDKARVIAQQHRVTYDSAPTTESIVRDIADIKQQFTHAAELHAAVVLNNFFSPLKKSVTYDKFSWVTYTTPEIATFGINEKDLKRRGLKYTIIKKDFKDDNRALTDDYPDSLMVLYISEDNKLLGGSIIAPRAGELAQELILAMSAGIKVDQVFSKIYPYPTATRINKIAISQLFSKKLKSKFNRSLLKLFYH